MADFAGFGFVKRSDRDDFDLVLDVEDVPFSGEFPVVFLLDFGLRSFFGFTDFDWGFSLGRHSDSEFVCDGSWSLIIRRPRLRERTPLARDGVEREYDEDAEGVGDGDPLHVLRRVLVIGD